MFLFFARSLLACPTPSAPQVTAGMARTTTALKLNSCLVGRKSDGSTVTGPAEKNGGAAAVASIRAVVGKLVRVGKSVDSSMADVYRDGAPGVGVTTINTSRKFDRL